MKKKIINIEWTQHDKYFKIALDNFEKIEILRKDVDTINRKKHEKKFTDDDVQAIAEINDSIGELALIVIIFSALSIEAYINHYAITRFSKNHFNKYLDKLDLFSKWILVPRIVTNKQLDPGSKSLQDVDWLIALRNKMVHYKSKQIQIDEVKKSDFLWAEDAEKAIKTVRNLVLSLKRIDEKVDVEWMQ